MVKDDDTRPLHRGPLQKVRLGGAGQRRRDFEGDHVSAPSEVQKFTQGSSCGSRPFA
jgi:hypothetical protein